MRPGKVICIGWNYKPHVAETDAVLPTEPIVFLKPSSCLCGDGDEVRIPEGVTNVQYEAELALVFGRTGKDIPEGEAMSHVSHLAVFNDITARDMQTADRKAGNPWCLAKGMDGFGPMSEPVPLGDTDPASLDLFLEVNGELRQRGNTSNMIFSLPELISYVSRFMTIEAGDVMATGTPEGIGEIRRGDTVTARIPGVGSVTNRIV
ncbi:MAG: fumarylacetoacetate hydrolase family protein [Thermoplasmatales archaeon]|nr:fumarylacetoacetate hydrolase family protein [Thermoplasmatales archaeon]